MFDVQLPVQQFLRDHTVGQLEDEFGVNVSVARAHPWKASINYDQIASKPGELVNQCRGLILTCEQRWPTEKEVLKAFCPGETRAIARPFDRFFNFGDPNAARIDWRDEELQVQTKLDGTLAIVYFDDVLNAWCMGTRSVPDADVPFGYFGGQMTFRQLFDRALRDRTGCSSLSEFMDVAPHHLTVMFELTSPLNRIVVDYNSYDITWLGMRDRRDSRELNYADFRGALRDIACESIPPCAPVIPLKGVDEVHAFLRDSNPMEIEGFVIVDSQKRRLKIKSAQYCEASKLKDACSSARNVLAIVLRGADDDVIPFVSKEVITQIDTLKTSFRKMELAIDQAAKDLQKAHPGDRKGYALAVTASGLWPAPMFDSLTKGRSLREFVEARKNADGSWPDGLLDTIMEQCEKHR